MHEKTKIEKMLREKAEAISSDYNGAPVVINVVGTGEIKMRKSFSIFFTLLFVSIGLTSSCSSYKNKKVNLYTGMQPAKINVSVTDFSSDFVELKIKVDESTTLQTEWLYHIIEDEQKNFISEGWYPTLINQHAAYTIKIKVKKGFFFLGKRFHITKLRLNVIFYSQQSFF